MSCLLALSLHRTRTLCLLLAWGLLSACASSPYHRALSTWTRDTAVYQQFDVAATITATLQSPAFRDAYITEYTRMFALSPEQAITLRASLADDDRRALTVIVAFYTARVVWNDLDPRRGIWEVRLENTNGDIAPPLSVRRLDKRNPTWKALFPYFAPHDTLYELRFERTLADGRPLATPGAPLSLVIAGAPAHIRLSWPVP